MRFRRHQEAADAATARLLWAFAGVVLAVVVVVNAALFVAYRLTLPIAGGVPALFFETNTALVLLFVLGGSWVESLRLRAGGAHVAKLAGARPASTGGHTAADRLEQRLCNVVHEMALAAGRRPPAVWVLPRDDTINAFAAGWGEADAVIALTRGALERLDRAELQGVVAHEMGHLVRGDARLNMRLIGLVWGLQMVHGLGRRLADADEYGRRGAGLWFGLALVGVGWLGWLGGRLLQASVSRQREFIADASAVQYTRLVDGIGGALRKIAGLAPAAHAPRPPESLAHLWLAAPAAAPRAAGWRAALRRALATHPPIDMRLQRLYGRPVRALPAEVLPAAAEEKRAAPAADRPPPRPADSVPPTVFVPRAGAAPARPDAPPEAARFDVTQHADRGSAAEREAEALQRIEFWHSRGERHAALLALLIADDGDAAPWPQWQQATAGHTSAATVRTEVIALRAAARLEVLDRLAARTAEAGDGRPLLHAAGALAGSDGARLRLWALRRRLHAAPRAPASRPRAATAGLQALAPAAAAADRLLAPLIGDAPLQSAPRGRPARQLLRAAFALRRLHPMQRPQLVRHWLQTAEAAGRQHDPAATGALLLACRLLDSPPPPALAATLSARR